MIYKTKERMNKDLQNKGKNEQGFTKLRIEWTRICKTKERMNKDLQNKGKNEQGFAKTKERMNKDLQKQMK